MPVAVAWRVCWARVPGSVCWARVPRAKPREGRKQSRRMESGAQVCRCWRLPVGRWRSKGEKFGSRRHAGVWGAPDQQTQDRMGERKINKRGGKQRRRKRGDGEEVDYPCSTL